MPDAPPEEDLEPPPPPPENDNDNENEDNEEDEDDGEDHQSLDEEDERAAMEADLFLGGLPGSMATMRAMAGMMSGMGSRLRTILDELRRQDALDDLFFCDNEIGHDAEPAVEGETLFPLDADDLRTTCDEAVGQHGVKRVAHQPLRRRVGDENNRHGG